MENETKVEEPVAVEYYAYYPIGVAECRVRFKASCQKGCAPPEQEGLSWVKSDVDFDPGEMRVVNGVLTPGALDDRTLELRRSEAWNRMRAARDAELNGGFQWDGSVFDSDPASQTVIQGKAAAATRRPTYSVEFTLKNNSTRVLTASNMIAVADALEAFVEAVHSKGAAVRAQINLSTEPEIITWPAS